MFILKVLTFFVVLCMIVVNTKFIYPEEYEEIKAWERCPEDELVPFYTNGTYSCFPLLEIGPCEENEWLILTENSDDMEAMCSERECESSEITEEIMFKGKCEIIEDPYVACPFSNMWLLPNPHGKGK